MEGFIAKHPSGKEEWLVSRHGRRFRKAQTKETSVAIVYHNIIKTYFNAVDALDAFHAEKNKAKSKGFNITDFDSTTPEPQRPKIKSLIERCPKVKALIKRRPRMVKVFGHSIPLEDP